MISWYRRITFAVFFAVLLVLAGTAPFAGADPANELALAMLEAEQGGYTGQCALRMMLWTEPAEIGPFVLLHPTPLEQAHLTEAEAKAKSALSAKPDLLPALILLGRLAWIDGRTNDALGYFQRALMFAPDSGQAQLGLIDLHLDRREREKAQAVPECDQIGRSRDHQQPRPTPGNAGRLAGRRDRRDLGGGGARNRPGGGGPPLPLGPGQGLRSFGQTG